MFRGELVLGVSSAPAFGEVAWAIRGGGAYLNDVPLAVSAITGWRDAAVSTGNLKSMTTMPARWAALGDLLGTVARNRGYGDFYHYHLLAAGKIEAIVESDLNILDIAALTVVIREAGGLVADLDGAPIGLETSSLLAATPALFDDLLRRFNSS